MKFGAHLSISKGPRGLLSEMERLGMNAAQIFARNPRGRGEAKIAEEDAAALRDELVKRQWQLLFHAPYYVNLGSGKANNQRISREVTKLDLAKGDYLGATGVVVHLGGPGEGFEIADGTKHVAGVVKEILTSVDSKCRLLLETSAGKKRVGADFEQMAAILKEIDNPERVGVCFDTCHVWTAGYDVRGKKIRTVLDHFDATVGLQNLDVIHCNDTLSEMDSGLDRHFHIGQGQIGQETFDQLVTDPRLKEIPFILETPKEDKEGKIADPDAVNLAALKSALS